MTTKDAANTKAPVVESKPANKLTFRDRLSQLNFLDACKLLGPAGKN
ncbi:hypothetical protein ETAA8_03930 [Anatilimnocola aggregata]|uniref:Uncharacterized protein n=1 Tax=Anatilimnocola aggregata TaxID=2528021 RepID=A0A517Y510_9BACT|nr:hypothetical protein [Anatilimnocola aggregata]QDU25328.1 hypothetical protein ETAA8_03930 [Anatilimnocola aggregata]